MWITYIYDTDSNKRGDCVFCAKKAAQDLVDGGVARIAAGPDGTYLEELAPEDQAVVKAQYGI